MSINKYFVSSVLTLIFGYLLTVSFFNLNDTDDAASYIRYYAHASDMIKNYGLRVIVNDIGFLSYLTLLDLASIPSSSIIAVLSLVNFALISASILYLSRHERRLGLLAVLILITSPIIALGYIIHFRQGFALGIFLLALCIQNLSLKNIESENNKILSASIFACFSHTSFLFIAAIYAAHRAAKTVFKVPVLATLSICLVVFFYLGSRTK